MGLFSNILDKLGFGSAPAQGATPIPAPASPSPQPAASSKPMAAVDVVAKLEGLAASHKERLNWKTSIVDLLKLVGLDSSLTARKELAKELNYTGDTNDSAKMNIWLHKQVMQKLADNGGKVPDSLRA